MEEQLTGVSELADSGWKAVDSGRVEVADVDSGQVGSSADVSGRCRGVFPAGHGDKVAVKVEHDDLEPTRLRTPTACEKAKTKQTCNETERLIASDERQENDRGDEDSVLRRSPFCGIELRSSLRVEAIDHYRVKYQIPDFVEVRIPSHTDIPTRPPHGYVAIPLWHIRYCLLPMHPFVQEVLAVLDVNVAQMHISSFRTMVTYFVMWHLAGKGRLAVNNFLQLCTLHANGLVKGGFHLQSRTGVKFLKDATSNEARWRFLWAYIPIELIGNSPSTIRVPQSKAYVWMEKSEVDVVVAELAAYAKKHPETGEESYLLSDEMFKRVGWTTSEASVGVGFDEPLAGADKFSRRDDHESGQKRSREDNRCCSSPLKRFVSPARKRFPPPHNVMCNSHNSKSIELLRAMMSRSSPVKLEEVQAVAGSPLGHNVDRANVPLTSDPDESLLLRDDKYSDLILRGIRKYGVGPSRMEELGELSFRNSLRESSRLSVEAVVAFLLSEDKYVSEMSLLEKALAEKDAIIAGNEARMHTAISEATKEVEAKLNFVRAELQSVSEEYVNTKAELEVQKTVADAAKKETDELRQRNSELHDEIEAIRNSEYWDGAAAVRNIIFEDNKSLGVDFSRVDELLYTSGDSHLLEGALEMENVN